MARKYSWFAHSELDNPRQRSKPFLEAMVDLAIFAPTGESLRVQSVAELDDVQRSLLDVHPDRFVFRRPPSGPTASLSSGEGPASETDSRWRW